MIIGCNGNVNKQFGKLAKCETKEPKEFKCKHVIDGNTESVSTPSELKNLLFVEHKSQKYDTKQQKNTEIHICNMRNIQANEKYE